MKSLQLLCLVPILGLAACAGQHPESTAVSAAHAQADDDATPTNSTVREPSRIHTYIVNDYIDPNNPRLRHRGHLVDVIEQDEKWNLDSADTEDTHLGPVATAGDPNAAPNPYSAEFETELAQQRDQFQQLAQLGSQMTAQMGRLQQLAEKSADVISENAELRNRLGTLQQEIDTLKPAAPPVNPDAPRKPSWLDSILNLFRQAPHGTPVVTDKVDPHADLLLRPPTTNFLLSPMPPSTNAPGQTQAEPTMPGPGEIAQPQDVISL